MGFIEERCEEQREFRGNTMQFAYIKRLDYITVNQRMCAESGREIERTTERWREIG